MKRSYTRTLEKAFFGFAFIGVVFYFFGKFEGAYTFAGASLGVLFTANLIDHLNGELE